MPRDLFCGAYTALLVVACAVAKGGRAERRQDKIRLSACGMALGCAKIVFVNELKRQGRKSDRATSVKVFIYDFSDEPCGEIDVSSVACEERKREILSARDFSERARKFYGWELLAFAFGEFGADINKADLRKNENGKWEYFGGGCDCGRRGVRGGSGGCADNDCEGKGKDGKIYFSISHTESVVAVAIAELPVGADIEKTNRTIKEGLFDRIATEEEKTAFSSSPTREDVLRLWTAKESVFKREGGKIFRPQKTNSLAGNVKTTVLREYGLIVSVACEGNFGTEINIVEKKDGRFGDAR